MRNEPLHQIDSLVLGATVGRLEREAGEKDIHNNS